MSELIEQIAERLPDEETGPAMKLAISENIIQIVRLYDREGVIEVVKSLKSGFVLNIDGREKRKLILVDDLIAAIEGME